MDRDFFTETILEAKRHQGTSFAQIAEALGTDRVWTTAAMFGQHPLSPEQAQTLVELLDVESDLRDDAVVALAEIPTRGSLAQVPPTDPTIYRLYEVLQVYGPALKALIHEDFGDGIMSAIGFNLSFEREDTDEGPRVRITLDGKFLPYSW